MIFADILGRDPLEFWLLAGLALVMLAALGRTAWRRRTMRAREEGVDPFLVFPEDAVRHPADSAPVRSVAAASSGGDREEGEADYRASLQPAAPPAPAPPAPMPLGPPYSARPGSTPRPAAWPAPPAANPGWNGRGYPSPAPPVDESSETIRLPTAADGTVQILPGMMVMTEGPEVGREFRFLRIGTQPVPELTIGRASGPPYRHIHLAAATVSRMHARLRFEEGAWRIANLSETNPLCVNAREVPPLTEVQLADGDRIQLGEVELSYRDGRS